MVEAACRFGVEDNSGMLKLSEHEVSSAEKEKGELLT
jgi:hypothetical protein